MASALNTHAGTEVPAGLGDSGRNGNGGPGDKGFGGGDPFEPLGWSVPPGAYRAGMWVAIASIAMFFGGLSSALLVRTGSGVHWPAFNLPRILYVDTLVLLLSSLAFEFSRRWLRAGMGRRFKIGLYLTLALGLIFIAGQIAAWAQLQSSGVYLTTNPSASFFYLLTAAHGLHLLGGIIALIYLVTQARYLALGIKRRTAFEVTALYWHFMDGLWIYLFALLIWKF